MASVSGGYNPIKTMASPQSSKGTSMDRMSFGGSRVTATAGQFIMVVTMIAISSM